MNVVNASVLSCLLSLAGLAGCVIEDDPPHRRWPEPASSTPDQPPSSTSTNVAPMLVEVDTDQTMNADGGEGVGVFIEYGKGGHWHIWWSCDTKQTSQACDFSVSATAASGSMTNLDTAELGGGVARATKAARIDVTSTTTTDVRGVRFDTDPGATITVEASVGSLKDGSFLFFVQDGNVNGGFAGVLTNPLQLHGTTP